METEEHKHVGKTFSANGEIVCTECVTEEQENGNECFCKCHENGKTSCKKCGVFHG